MKVDTALGITGLEQSASRFRILICLSSFALLRQSNQIRPLLVSFNFTVHTRRCTPGLAIMDAWGPSIKYVTLEGEGVRESVTVCDRGRGQGWTGPPDTGKNPGGRDH